MRKIHLFGVALLALFAFSAVAAGTASANEWAKGGVKITKEEAATSEGTIVLSDTVLFITGEVECDGKFIGDVGGTEGGVFSASLDKTTLVEGLGGEQDLVTCKVKSSASVGKCATGSLVLVHAEKLPWTTKLLGSGTAVEDMILNGAYDVLCGTELVALCETASENEPLIKNTASGAEFEFKGRTSGEGSCSNGGTGFITGKGTTLGFEAV